MLITICRHQPHFWYSLYVASEQKSPQPIPVAYALGTLLIIFVCLGFYITYRYDSRVYVCKNAGVCVCVSVGRSLSVCKWEMFLSHLKRKCAHKASHVSLCDCGGRNNHEWFRQLSVAETSHTWLNVCFLVRAPTCSCLMS